MTVYFDVPAGQCLGFDPCHQYDGCEYQGTQYGSCWNPSGGDHQQQQLPLQQQHFPYDSALDHAPPANRLGHEEPPPVAAPLGGGGRGWRKGRGDSSSSSKHNRQRKGSCRERGRGGGEGPPPQQDSGLATRAVRPSPPRERPHEPPPQQLSPPREPAAAPPAPPPAPRPALYSAPGREDGDSKERDRRGDSERTPLRPAAGSGSSAGEATPAAAPPEAPTPEPEQPAPGGCPGPAPAAGTGAVRRLYVPGGGLPAPNGAHRVAPAPPPAEPAGPAPDTVAKRESPPPAAPSATAKPHRLSAAAAPFRPSGRPVDSPPAARPPPAPEPSGFRSGFGSQLRSLVPVAEEPPCGAPLCEAPPESAPPPCQRDCPVPRHQLLSPPEAVPPPPPPQPPVTPEAAGTPAAKYTPLSAPYEAPAPELPRSFSSASVPLPPVPLFVPPTHSPEVTLGPACCADFPDVGTNKRGNRMFSPNFLLELAARPVPPPPPSLVAEDSVFVAEAQVPCMIEDPPTLGDTLGVPSAGSALRHLNRSTDVLARKVNGILNRMTPQKFNKLVAELLKQIVTEVKCSEGETMKTMLEKVAPLIFDKAVSEPHFSELYGELCSVLHHGLEECGVASGEDGDGVIKTSKQRFQALLLNLCQREFEASWAVAANRAMSKSTDPNEQAAHRRAKVRKLGNIKLIAELFKRKLMPEQIVHLVAQRLLMMSSDSEEPSENDVEILCKLFDTAGQRMDRPAAQEYMSKYFKRMSRLCQQHSSSRARFLLLNVLDLRASQWQPRVQEDRPQKLTPSGGHFARSSSCGSMESRTDESPRESPMQLGRRGSVGAMAGRTVVAPNDPVARTVYITGIDTAMNPGELEAWLGSFGRIAKRRLCGDPSHPTQYGFFEFDSHEAAAAVVEHDKTQLGRYQLHCSMAKAAIHDTRDEDQHRGGKRSPGVTPRGTPVGAAPLLARSPSLSGTPLRRQASSGSFAGVGGACTPPFPPTVQPPPSSTPPTPAAPAPVVMAGGSFADRFAPALADGPLRRSSWRSLPSPGAAPASPGPSAAAGSAAAVALAVLSAPPPALAAGSPLLSPEPPAEGPPAAGEDAGEEEVDRAAAELKGRSLLDELVANQSMSDFLDELMQLPAGLRRGVLAHQFTHASSQTRLSDERQALSDVAFELCGTPADRDLVVSAWAQAVGEWVQTELWVDAPVLWRSAAWLLADCVLRGTFLPGDVAAVLAPLAASTEECEAMSEAWRAHCARFDSPPAVCAALGACSWTTGVRQSPEEEDCGSVSSRDPTHPCGADPDADPRSEASA